MYEASNDPRLEREINADRTVASVVIPATIVTKHSRPRVASRAPVAYQAKPLLILRREIIARLFAPDVILDNYHHDPFVGSISIG